MDDWRNIFWDAILKHVKNDFILTVFKSLTFKTFENGIIKAEVPDILSKNLIESSYLDILHEAIFQETGIRVDLKLVISKDKKDSPRSEILVNLLNEKKDSQNTVLLGSLRSNYTFEEFVSGPSNEFAYNACLACADSPGVKTSNPLFIYGGVGLGKTHLINAIGHRLLQNFKTIRLGYASAEKFMNEYIAAIRTSNIQGFKKRYRENCDALLIDDIQFLEKKERTIEEFFHTFNELYENNKQIVVTSDRYPKDIHFLEDRLISRFEGGLIADIQPPDIETRIAILKRKAENFNVVLPEEVIEYIASHIKSNVRELEGSLSRIKVWTSLSKKSINIDNVKDILNIFIKEPSNQISSEKILKVVTSHYNISHSDLRSNSRKKTFVIPRQISMYLCKKLIGSPYQIIGELFGGKDHSTVMHACEKIENLIEEDINLKSILDSLEKTIIED